MDTQEQEPQVREYYDDAGDAFSLFMGPKEGEDPREFWHHGWPDAEERGLNPTQTGLEFSADVAKLAGLKPGALALDFGTGPGGAAIHMAITSGACVVGVSNNAKLTSKARAAAHKLNVADQVFFHDIGDWEYKSLKAWPPASFDAITFYESVCHLPDEGKKEFLEAAHSRLKVGGRLVGIDWARRPFGDIQDEDQIKRLIEPVNYGFQVLVQTIEFYAEAITAAGFALEKAEDMWPGKQCWGSTPDPGSDPQGWTSYDGKQGDRFAGGKLALDDARRSGVFTIGLFVATKPR